MPLESPLTWPEFLRVELRAGTITRVEAFPEARKPAWKVWIDLGELGIKKSSAQLCTVYSQQDLLGKQVLCVCNFGPKQIGPFQSEVLVTGLVEDDRVVLVVPDQPVANGTRLG